jgi:hypothetical protein
MHPPLFLITTNKCITNIIKVQGVRARGIPKIHAYVLVPKSSVKFMFSTVYRVTQKEFYAHAYTSIWPPDLRQCIIEAIMLMTLHILINTWQKLEYRLDVCQATTGAYIEVYGRALKTFQLLYTMLKNKFHQSFKYKNISI